MIHFFRAVLLLLLLVVPTTAEAVYTCTVTPTSFFALDGGKYIRLLITETEANDASECTITGLQVFGTGPQSFGTTISYRADRTAGTGATIDPLVGVAAGFAVNSIDQVWDSPTTADFVSFPTPVFLFFSPSSMLFLRSRPNSAVADHSISTEIVIYYGRP